MSHSTQPALQVASDRIVKRDDQIQRALQVLQAALRFDLNSDNIGATMVHCTHGDYVDISDAQKAIQILQEGQQ